jgi:hypothetical protein
LGDAVSPVQAIHARLSARRSSPDLPQLIDWISACSNAFSSTFVIFDALDVCAGEERRKLLPAIGKLSAANIKVFATSRDYLDDVKALFQSSLQIVIRADILDLKKYLTRAVSEQKFADEILRRKTVETLSENAKGV